MSELIFMPTPNWFTSKPIDICQNDGSIAITAINSIIFTKNLFQTYDGFIKDAHTKRINCVAFHFPIQKEGNISIKLIASCSEDLDIKVWNAFTKQLVVQHKLHQNAPSCLDWLNFQNSHDSILISCDVKGNIFKWNINTNEHSRYFPENKPITQVKSCPNQNLIAIGYKQGAIVILDISSDQMKIIHKLKTHEDTINCLCWFPHKSECDLTSDESTSKLKSLFNVNDLSMVLCSSSEDRTIRLWCTIKGVELKCIKSPGISSASSRKGNQGQALAKINYTPLCWPSTRYIISGSFKGELSYIDLLNEDNRQIVSDQTAKWRFFSKLSSDKTHKKIIYDISNYNETVITIGLDRLINIWNMTNFKQEHSLTTLNGYIYSIASSPIDSNVLAISVGDSSIKILNTKDNEKFAKSFNNNIKSEVTQICWHPSKESIISFGTKDGKIGIADIMSSNKTAQYIYNGYNQSVYTLLWSDPILFEEDSTNQNETLKKSNYFYLYSVSDGKIMQHQVQFLGGSGSSIVNPDIQTKNFYKELILLIEKEDIDKTKVNDEINKSNKTSHEFGLTEFAVLKIEPGKTDHFMAIGKFDGTIEIYRSYHKEKKIIRLCTFFNHQKLVTSLKWNKNVYDDKLKSEIYLASGSNDYSVIIIDFKNLINDFEANNFKNDSKLFSKFKHKLIGHKERITGLSWSTKSTGENILASCSYDSTVQIWNADTGIPLANYRGHFDKLLCCTFSNYDSNLVYSGGEDYCLHKWKIDAQTETIPPEECSVLTGKKKNKFVKKMQSSKKVESDEAESEKLSKENEFDSMMIIQDTELVQSISNNEFDEINELKSKSEVQHFGLTTDKQQFSQVKISKKQIKVGAHHRVEIKNLFLLSSHGSKTQKLKLQDCLYLFEILYEKHSSFTSFISEGKNSFPSKKIIDFDFDLCKFEFEKDKLNLCLFGNRMSTLEMIRCEQAELKRLNFEKWWIFDIWRGNILKIVSEFKQQNNIDDFLFSLYHISIDSNNNASSNLLDNYIEQLSKSTLDHINKAVMYALASYDVKKAIDIYLANNLYQYALCLAQLRLPPKSPILNQVLNKYAKFANTSGDYETAALCYIRLGDFENGFKCLIRRNCKNDLESENLIKNILEKFSLFMPDLNIVSKE